MSGQRSAHSGSAPLPVQITGTPDATADAALARWFEQWLERQHPGTTWQVAVPPVERVA